MSKLVDERVVKMAFDNSKFEKNVQQSTESLEALKESMDLSKQAKGFSALEVAAVSALATITSRVTNLGINLVKSLSIDQVVAGFEKYGEQIRSTGTLIAQGMEEAVVDEQLSKLQFFADETSYSFEEMFGSVTKFTAAGKTLEDSVSAVMGIATWAASAGQNASTASRAMYQLSQAVSAGTVRLEDWRSIQSANMDTQEFRQTVADTAVELGVLSKTIDGQYITAQGHAFELANLTNYLTTDMWLNSDVLIETLKKYSSTVDDIYQAVEGADAEYNTASEAIENMSDQLDAFGLKNFKAAQEARTLEDAITATKDAVASQWKGLFATIFGGYEESVALWTKLANELWDVFAGPLSELTETFSEWRELGGADDLFSLDEDDLGAFWNLFYAVTDIVNTIRDAWRTVFPTTAEGLKSFSERLKNITASLRLTENGTETLSRICKTLFSVLKVGVSVIKSAFNILKPFASIVKDVLTAVAQGIGEGNLSGELIDFGDAIINTSKAIGNFVASTYAAINRIVPIKTILSTLIRLVSYVISTVTSLLNTMSFANKEMAKTAESAEETVSPLVAIFTVVKELISKVWDLVMAVMPILFNLLDKLRERISMILSSNESLFDLIKDFFKIGIMGSILAGLAGFKDIVGSLGDILDSLNKVLRAYSFEKNMEAIKQLAISIAILSLSFALIASIDKEKFANAALVIAALMTYLLVALSVLTKMFNAASKSLKDIIKQNIMMNNIVKTMKNLAIAVLILALAMKTIGNLDSKQLLRGLVAITVLLAELVLITKILESSSKKSKVQISGLISLTLSVMLLCLSLKMISKMSWESLAKGLVGVTVILAEFTAIIKILSSSGTKALKSFVAMQGLIALSASMVVLALAMKILASMPLLQLLKSLGAMATILMTVVLLGNFVKAGNLIGLGAALIFIAASMIGLSVALKVISTIPLASLAVSIGAIAALLLTFVALSKVVKFFKMVSITASLMVLSASLIVLSAALIGLSIAISAFKSFSLMEIGTALLTIAGVLVILGLAALFLKPLEKTILAISFAFLMFAAAVYIVAEAVRLIAYVIQMLSDLDIKYGLLIATITESIPSLVDLISSVLTSILNLLIDNIPLIAETIATAIDGILGAVADKFPSILASIFDMIKSLLAALRDNIGEIAASLIELLINLIDKVIEYLPKIFEKLKVLIQTVITEAVNFVIEMVPFLIDSMYNLIVGLIDGLGEAIERNAGRITAAAVRFIIHVKNAIVKEASVIGKTAGELGKNLLEGLKNGIANAVSGIKTAVTNVANTVVGWFKNIFQIHSPSRIMEEIGQYLDEGLSEGIDAGTKDIYKSALSAGDGVVSGFEDSGISDAIMTISDAISNGIDEDALTIRPVIDLSDVKSGMSSINNLVSSADGYSISGSNDLANTTSYELGRSRTSRMRVGSSGTLGTDIATTISNTFNITSNNPKEVAEEVSKVMQNMINRRNARYGQRNI